VQYPTSGLVITNYRGLCVAGLRSENLRAKQAIEDLNTITEAVILHRRVDTNTTFLPPDSLFW